MTDMTPMICPNCGWIYGAPASGTAICSHVRCQQAQLHPATDEEVAQLPELATVYQARTLEQIFIDEIASKGQGLTRDDLLALVAPVPAQLPSAEALAMWLSVDPPADAEAENWRTGVLPAWAVWSKLRDDERQHLADVGLWPPNWPGIEARVEYGLGRVCELYAEQALDYAAQQLSQKAVFRDPEGSLVWTMICLRLCRERQEGGQ